MKKVFVYSLLAALTITGCQAELVVDEQEGISQEPSKVFTATVEDDFGGDTKTSLNGSGNVLWKQYDQVSIFHASTVNEQYQVSDASDGKTSATLNPIPSGGFVAGTDIDNNVAFYPYASTATLAKDESNYVISDIELPASQSYAEGSFGNGAFPMAAVTSSTEDMNLKFKNVLGGLKLQLKGTATITSITVTGNNNEILCGDAEVTTTYGGVPSITLSDASAKTVTLDCGAGVTLDSETATPFIIALPPMTMTGGFTVVVTDSESKQMEISSSRSQTITRSNLLKMPAVNYVGTMPMAVPEAVDLGLSVKWASFNIGASAPEEYGYYYAWGETEPKSESDSYWWTTYKWGASSLSLTKYNVKGTYGTVDDKTELDPEDDVAHVKLGGTWRMPTKEEWTELATYCTWTWTSRNGINGRLVTAYNGHSIFLPAAGYYSKTGHIKSPIGNYWSPSIDLEFPYTASYMNFNSDYYDEGEYDSAYRCFGMSVRPVCE